MMALCLPEILNPDDPITNLHQQLVSAVTRRPVTVDNWQYILNRMAYSMHVITDMDMEYDEYNVKERLSLLKVISTLIL